MAKGCRHSLSTASTDDAPLAAQESVLHGSQALAAQWHAWQKTIEMLKDWLQDTALLEDEGVEAPALETIQAAIRRADLFRAQGIVPPDHVVCDPNGGIVFRRHEGDTSEELHFSEDGCEYRLFDGTRLVERRRS